jgi:hypothetical protein
MSFAAAQREQHHEKQKPTAWEMPDAQRSHKKQNMIQKHANTTSECVMPGPRSRKDARSFPSQM